ncbi:MAG: hypothetical protein QW124_06190 [Thermoplasmata archaeon]
MDILSFLKFLTGIVFLSIASIQDIREREISPIIFLLMGTFAIFYLFYQFTLNLQIIIIILIFLISFIDLGKWDHILNAVFIIMIFIFNSNIYLFVTSLLLIIYKYMYNFKFFTGKADMRAAISITLLTPMYPETFTPFHIHNNIVSIIFPFSIQVLFYATIINIIIFMPYVFYKNYKNGIRKFPEMLIKIYNKGVWESYQTPFIFSILLAFVLSFIVQIFYFIPS